MHSLARSAKWMQQLLDVAYNNMYGCKSQMMVFDARKIGHTVDLSIGSSVMNKTTSYRY